MIGTPETTPEQLNSTIGAAGFLICLFDLVVFMFLAIGQYWLLAALWAVANIILLGYSAHNLMERKDELLKEEKPAKVETTEGNVDWGAVDKWLDK